MKKFFSINNDKMNRIPRIVRIKKLGVATLVAALAITMAAGCSTATKATDSAASETKSGSTASAASATSLDIANMFTDRDLDSSYDESEAETITLSDDKSSSSSKNVEIDGQTITIKAEGIYVLSGKLSDGQIVVDTNDDSAKVQLVLDGVSIENDSTACIYTKTADKVFVTSKDGSKNTLAVTGDYEKIDDNNIDAVIFAKTDLTLNGTGSITIEGSTGHGVVSKDDLKVAETGTYIITAKNHALSGKDSVRIANGTFDLTAGKDAIHSGNDEDANKGYVYVADGKFTINADDDGIHADNETYIDGGTITIAKSNEGIEGSIVTINNGRIDITSSDDGVNAAGGSDDSDKENQDPFANDDSAAVYITGGEIIINAEGDGLDSNGLLSVSGGTTYISGPTNDGNGALDCGGEATITGGTIIAAGSSGMAETFGENSTQASMIVYLDSVQTGTITLKDSDGKEVASYTPEKKYQSVVISTADIAEDGTYTLTAGSETQEVKMDGLVYGQGSGMGGHGGGGRGDFGGNGKDGNDGGFKGGPQDGNAPDNSMTPPDMNDGTNDSSDGNSGSDSKSDTDSKNNTDGNNSSGGAKRGMPGGNFNGKGPKGGHGNRGNFDDKGSGISDNNSTKEDSGSSASGA